jgi:hypothetical protein
MLDWLKGAWDAVLHVVATAPLGFWALVLGLCGSVALTQWVKKSLPGEWMPASEDGRRRATNLFAMVVGLGIVWGVWPNLFGFVSGLIVGASSLVVYKGVAWFVRLRWPKWAEGMSQETREFKKP